MTLKKTEKTISKLIEMARELNSWNDSCDWANTFDIEDADDHLVDMKPSEILRTLFFGNIEKGVGFTDAELRFNDYGNLEIISSHTLEHEAWDYRNEILDDYRNEFGEDKLDKCLSEMDETPAIG